MNKAYNSTSPTLVNSNNFTEAWLGLLGVAAMTIHASQLGSARSSLAWEVERTDSSQVDSKLFVRDLPLVGSLLSEAVNRSGSGLAFRKGSSLAQGSTVRPDQFILPMICFGPRTSFGSLWSSFTQTILMLLVGLTQTYLDQPNSISWPPLT